MLHTEEFEYTIISLRGLLKILLVLQIIPNTSGYDGAMSHLWLSYLMLRWEWSMVIRFIDSLVVADLPKSISTDAYWMS